MIREWNKRSADGRRSIQLGFGQMDAVGAPKPSDAVPIGEGLRLVFAKGVDRIWLFAKVNFLLHLFFWKRKQKRKKRNKRSV